MIRLEGDSPTLENEEIVTTCPTAYELQRIFTDQDNVFGFTLDITAGKAMNLMEDEETIQGSDGRTYRFEVITPE